MNRRDLMTLIGGAAVWPVAAHAQQGAVPVVAYIDPVAPSAQRDIAHAAFERGLKETGFIQGQNIAVEYHYGNSQPERVKEIATNLVRRKVAAIASVGGVPTAQIVKATTSTIPIIFEVGSNPVQDGLVGSLSRPGGNLTGVNSVIGELWPKQLDLMARLLPNAHVFGALFTGGDSPERVRLVQMAAEAVGRKLVVASAFTPQEFEAGFAALAQQGAEALIIGASPQSVSQPEQLANLAAHYSLPTIYAFREIPKAGGLMSYGIDILESHRLVGVYTGRILKGEKPAELPVVQSARFVLAINLKTAKNLGLTVPPSLLAIADEVIE
jgi:putative ABC transport system substrate-binding protein